MNSDDKDRLVAKAKDLTRAVVPKPILDDLWGRYLASKDQGEVSVATSIVDSPDKLAEIRRHYVASNNAPDFLKMSWLRRRIAEVGDPALKSYFAIAPDDETPSLCAPSHNYRALVDSVIAVAVQSNLQVAYVHEGTPIIVSNYSQLLRDIQARQWVQLRLVSYQNDLAVNLESWQIEDNVLVAPRSNPITRKIYLDSPSAKKFLETPGKMLDELYPTPLAEECNFDVDVVYTWVDFEDPDWQQLLADHTGQPVAGTESSEGDDEEVDSDRFLSRDELRFSLRSLLKYAPWVRTVYIVTNCKPPDWFDETNERVRWVYHEEIIDEQHLPTFSSHAIEASVHKVPGLAEHFLYFNDDLFLLKPVEKCDFFMPNGLAKIRPEPYGMVHGDIDPEAPDYINAARNVQRLLQDEFGKTVTKLHTHSPQSVRLSVIQQCEATFPEAYEVTRSNRFRAVTDISPTSFMYPSFAYLTGNAVMDYPNISLINVAKPYQASFKSFLGAMNNGSDDQLPLTLCINDGGGSAADENWGDAIVNFMNAAFGEMSEAERAYEGFGL